jgi:hypothetical protein
MDRGTQMIAMVLMATYGFALGAGVVGLVWWLS